MMRIRRASFHGPVGHPYAFFGKVSVQILCPFFNWTAWGAFVYFDVELCVFHMYLDIKTHFHKHDLQICFPFTVLPLRLVDGFLCCAEAFQFDAVSLVDACFCSLCFWCQIQKLIAKTDVKEASRLCFLLGVIQFRVLHIQVVNHLEG